jgi:hypothetical protein
MGESIAGGFAVGKLGRAGGPPRAGGVKIAVQAQHSGVRPNGRFMLITPYTLRQKGGPFSPGRGNLGVGQNEDA